MDVQVPKAILPLWQSLKRFKLLHGGRAGGKSWGVADYLIIQAYSKKIRVLCSREVQNSLDESVIHLLKQRLEALGLDSWFVFKNNKLICTTTGSEFIFKGLMKHNRFNIKSLEGIDYLWVEEAQAVSKESLDELVPTIRKDGSVLIFTMNRYMENDPVWVRFGNDPDTEVLKINWYDNIFCPQPIKDLALKCKKDNPSEYLHTWEGEPINQADLAIISRQSVHEAYERVIEPDGQIEFGCDIARFGNDRTVIIKRKGLKMLDYWIFTKMSTVEVSEFIMSEATQQDIIKVDDTGVGGGVTDILMNANYNVMPINFGESPVDKDSYPNRISEMWFQFKDTITEAQLIDIDGLTDELCQRQWKMDNKGRRQVEGKDVFKKRHGRSPDIADAVLLCYYNAYAEVSIEFF